MGAQGSLKTITAGVVEEAKKEAAAITKQAESEAAELIAEKQKEVDTFLADAKKRSERDVAQIERTELAKANFELKNSRLNKIRDLVDECFDATHKMLASAQSKKQADVAKALLANAKKQIDVAKVRAKASVAGSLGKVKVEKEDMDGIVAETKDGSISIDLTYGTLLDSIKQAKVEEIIGELER